MDPAHLWVEHNSLTFLFRFLMRFYFQTETQFKWLTKTWLNAAGVNPDSVSNAAAAAKGRRRIGT